jgi:hypothetical protein
MHVEKYQLVAYALVTFITIIWAWSQGFKEGKRVGYHKGRNITWSSRTNKVSQ